MVLLFYNSFVGDDNVLVSWSVCVKDISKSSWWILMRFDMQVDVEIIILLGVCHFLGLSLQT